MYISALDPYGVEMFMVEKSGVENRVRGWNFLQRIKGQLDRAEICLKFDWLFRRFEDTRISFWD